MASDIPVGPFRRLLNALTGVVMLAIVAFIIVEALTLVYVSPMITQSIVTADIGSGSSIILPEDSVKDSKGNIDFSLSPQVNGSMYIEDGYLIFVPSSPLIINRYYEVNYGEGHHMRIKSTHRFEAQLLSTNESTLIISFSQNVSHSQAESLIEFSPPVTYSTKWYGNTLVIDVSNTSLASSFSMKGTLYAGGESHDISIEAEYTPGGVFSRNTQVPSMPSTVLFVLIPPGIIAGISYLEGSAFQLYFMFILVSVVLSVGYAFYADRGKFIRLTTFNLQKGDMPVPSRSVLLEISMLLTATMFFSMLSYLLVGMMGEHPKVPSMQETPLWFNLYSLARAGVWEEIITRIPFIGFFLLIIHLYMKNRKTLPLWRYVLGGGFEMDNASMGMLFLSAFFFGLAHAFGGWDVFKVLPAMVAGLAMGYLFLKWGIYASITLHFANDFLSMPSEVFPSTATESITGVLFIAMLAIGVYTFTLYLVAFLRKYGLIQSQRTAAGAYRSQYAYWADSHSQYQQYQSNGYSPPNPQNTQYSPASQQMYGYPAYQNYQGYDPYPQYPQYPAPPQPQYPQQYGGYGTEQNPAASISVSPSGYVSYTVSQNKRPELPIAPYPFRCIRCGGTIAMYKEGGKVVCMNCGMEYMLNSSSPQTVSSDSAYRQSPAAKDRMPGPVQREVPQDVPEERKESTLREEEYSPNVHEPGLSEEGSLEEVQDKKDKEAPVNRAVDGDEEEKDTEGN